MIDAFIGPNRFLSNFYPAEVAMGGLEFSTVEHAYQAMKTLDQQARYAIKLQKFPSAAKRMGRVVKIRADWDQVKDEIMLELLRQKFKHIQLRERLLATGREELIEGNTWGDTYWGVCRGVGENRLGKLLMQVRTELVTNERWAGPGDEG